MKQQKMEMKTKIISREIIKPSSPTPKSLQKYQLSFIDKATPPIFAPFVYFFSPNPIIPTSQKSHHLKRSLSDTLTRFYPLAGRLVGNLHVDCNDGGAPFAEAEANCNLSDITTNPNPKKIKKLLLYKFDDDSSSQALCMAVQITYFRCGGLAIGLVVSHKLADAISIVNFVNSWSAASRNGGVPNPKFNAVAYFPPRDIISRFNPSVGITPEEEVSTGIVRFSAEKIAALREMYAGDSPAAAGRLPSRVDALSAYLWTRFLSATCTQRDSNKIYSMRHAVNLRSRVDQPMSEYHFGNIHWLSITKPEAGDGGAELIRKIGKAKKALYEGYAAELREMNAVSELTSQASHGERVVSFFFTSLCGFPIYEADFGWGKPDWVVSPGFPHKNVVIFTDAKGGGGIEALIHLKKSDMEKFQADFELQMLKSNL